MSIIRRSMMRSGGSSIDWESIARGMIDYTTIFNADSLISGMTSIASYLFYGRKGLQSVEIPSAVTSIGAGAFFGCTGLTSIVIPNLVTTIGDNAFNGCSNLTSITIGNSVTSIGITTFNNCSKVTSLVFPNSVTSIGNQGCRGMSELKTVDIGTGITSISNMAFYQCSKVQYYIIRATTPPTLGASALSGVSGWVIYVPDASVSTYQGASVWSSYSSKIKGISEIPT